MVKVIKSAVKRCAYAGKNVLLCRPLHFLQPFSGNAVKKIKQPKDKAMLGLGRLFVKLNGKYHVSKSDYYSNILSPKTPGDLLKISQNGQKGSLYAADTIRFNNFDFGVTSSEVQGKLGAPRFAISRKLTDRAVYKVLFYKDTIGKRKVVSQYHFLDDRFILGNHNFYDRFEGRDVDEIESLLKEKYLPQEKEADLRKNSIYDPLCNKIELVNSVSLSLLYITGDHGTKEKISALVQQEAAKARQKETALLMRIL